MNAIADGVIDASDTFRETVREAEEEVERIGAIIAEHERIIAARVSAISSDQAENFAAQIREKLAESSPAIRKRIIRSFVSEVHVSDQEIAIFGAKSDLAEIVTGSLKP